MLPRLYANLVLRVPQIWFVLPRIESLVASGGEGLQYTTSLKITTDVRPVPAPMGRVKGHGLYPIEGPTNTPEIYFPELPASMNLNCLVRLLLQKLPKKRLKEFMYVPTVAFCILISLT